MKKSTIILWTVTAALAIGLPTHQRTCITSAMGALAVFAGTVVRPTWLGLLIP
ncbi:MAG: hypothetical protein U0936_02830 [Planctomycetaceae bacterium]